MLTSCGVFSKKDKTPVVAIKKSFFNRMIVYTIESPETMSVMRKIENLQKQKFSDKDPKVSSDTTVIRLYRDADMNRDRIITLEEAKMMQTQYSFAFEDSLGRLE